MSSAIAQDAAETSGWLFNQLCLLELINCSLSTLFELAVVKGHIITSRLPFSGASTRLCAMNWMKELL